MIIRPINYYKFRYAAIRRFGERRWIAADGFIEINPTYTVSCSTYEKGCLSTDSDKAYIIELSNGTKFLCFLCGLEKYDNVLADTGELANMRADHEACLERTKRYLYELNNCQN